MSNFLASLTSPASTTHDDEVTTLAAKRRRTLVGIPYEVSRGQGGWDACQQTFSVRGLNYLNDNIKVLLFL